MSKTKLKFRCPSKVCATELCKPLEEQLLVQDAECECCGGLIQDQPKEPRIHCFICGFMNVLDSQHRLLLGYSKSNTIRPVSRDRIRAINRAINCNKYKKELRKQLKLLKKVMEENNLLSNESKTGRDISQEANSHKRRRINSTQDTSTSKTKLKSTSPEEYSFQEFGVHMFNGRTPRSRLLFLHYARSYQTLLELNDKHIEKDDSSYIESFLADNSHKFGEHETKFLELLYGNSGNLELIKELKTYVNQRPKIIWYRRQSAVLEEFQQSLKMQFEHTEKIELSRKDDLPWNKLHPAAIPNKVILGKVRKSLVNLYIQRDHVAKKKWDKIKTALIHTLGLINNEMNTICEEVLKLHKNLGKEKRLSICWSSTEQSDQGKNQYSQYPLFNAFYKAENEYSVSRSKVRSLVLKWRILSLGYKSIVSLLVKGK